MRVASSVVLLLLACRSEADAKPPALTWSHDTLTKAERASAASKIIAAFPRAWRAKATVDELGLPEEIELQLPTPLTDKDEVERVLAIVRERPALFGVRDPNALHGTLEYGDVWIGEGNRWTGQVMARFDHRHLTLRGHLWDLETPAISTQRAGEVIAPFVGLTGSEPSKCICPHDSISVELRRESFELTPGVALVCENHRVTARAAIAIRALVGNGANVPGLEKLPRLVDAATLQRIDADFILPPRGELAEAGPVFHRDEHKWLPHNCFDASARTTLDRSPPR